MVTISIVSFPPESAKEMGKRFMEMTPIPNFIELSGPYLYAEGGEGNKSITIYKYDKTRAAEANEAIANAMTEFYGVPGFTYDLKLASGSATALNMLGMA